MSFKTPVACKTDRPLAFHGVPQDQQAVVLHLDPRENRLGIRMSVEDGISELVQDRMVSSGGILKSDRFRSQDRLELRLSQVHSLMVNVLLINRIDQAGNITVVIDVLSNLCGADIFQLARQLQLHDFSPDLIVDLGRMCFSGPSEYDVIEEMDRIFFRLFLIGTLHRGRIGRHPQCKFL